MSVVVLAQQNVLGAACGTGILDCLTAKTTELGTLFRALASVAGVGFVLWQGISSRGAMARILISGLAAGVFVWIVFNVTNLQNRVQDEVGAPAVHLHRDPGAVTGFTAAGKLPGRSPLAAAADQVPVVADRRAGQVVARWS